jgi:hypothetical protein
MMDKDQNSDDVRIFVGDTEGPDDFAGFFEDDGETGYLYVSNRKLNKIVRHLQIYNEAKAINPQEQDVSVVWSADGQKCGVIIFDGMRGIIDLRRGIEGRSKMTDRSSPPIDDTEWLGGFEKHLT